MSKRHDDRIPRYGLSVEEGPLRATVSLDLEPVFRLVSEFLSLRCAPDLLEMGVFPRSSVAKEVTESMAAFVAVRRELGVQRFGDESVSLFDVGAGTAPRTAALFAHRSRWTCYAVDPALKPREWEAKVKRLALYPERIQDVALEVGGLAVVALVHAHVEVVDALRSIRAPEYLVVALPCCVPHVLPVEPQREYSDMGCWSPQRKVKIWHLTRVERDELVAPKGGA